MPENFKVEGVWDRQHLTSNARALRDLLDSSLNTVVVEPMMIFPQGDAVLASDNNINCPVLDFPNGTDNGTNRCRLSIYKPEHWRNGTVGVWVMYTQATADSSNFKLTMTTFPGDANNTNTAASTSQDFPGCSPAYSVKLGLFVPRIVVWPQTLHIGCRLGRDGLTDANAQAVRVLRVLFKFTPSMREQ